jgi:hypothetical protein
MRTFLKGVSVVLVVLLCLGGLGLGFWLVSSQSLRNLKARLRAKAEKLAIEELLPGLGTNDLSAHQRFLAIAGELQAMSTAVSDLLGTGRFDGQNAAQGVVSTDRLWTQLALEVNRNREYLPQLHDALAQPAHRLCNHPNVYLGAHGLPFPQREWQNAALLVGSAAVLDHRESKWLPLKRDLTDLAKLVNTYADEPWLTCQSARCAAAHLAQAITLRALQGSAWADAELTELQELWQKLSFAGPMILAYEAVRIDCLDSFERQRRAANLIAIKGLPKRLGQPLWHLVFSRGDERTYLEASQRILEQLRLGLERRSLSSVQAELALIETENLQRQAAQFANLRFALSSRLARVDLDAFKVAMRAETRRNHVLTAIALERYRLRYQRLPPSVQPLVPRFLNELPVDYITGEPIAYQLKADGTILLRPAIDE